MALEDSERGALHTRMWRWNYYGIETFTIIHNVFLYWRLKRLGETLGGYTSFVMSASRASTLHRQCICS